MASSRIMTPLFEHWRPLLALVEREILSRYFGSFLGSVWAIVHPLSLILVYVYVFSVVLQIKVGEGSSAVDYGVFLFAGFLPWRAIHEVLGRSPQVLLEQARLIEKTALPPALFPAAQALACLVNLFVEGTLFIIVLFVVGRAPDFAGCFWLVTLTPFLLVLCVGLAMLLSAMNSRIRDTAQVSQVVGLLWFLATPIIYPPEMVPQSLRWLVQANPLSPLVAGSRASLLHGESPSLADFALFAGFALVTFAVGTWVFKRASANLLDHV